MPSFSPMPSLRKRFSPSAKIPVTRKGDVHTKRKRNDSGSSLFELFLGSVFVSIIVMIFLFRTIGGEAELKQTINELIAWNEAEIHDMDIESSLRYILSHPEDRSAQRLAMEWMVHSDPMHLPPQHPSFLQRYALATLYFATSPPSWKECSAIPSTPCHQNTKSKRFLDGGTECHWYGTNCKNDRVTWLDLTNNGLNGPIPDEIRFLTGLELFWLSENEITGSIPSWIGGLTHLQSLSLYRTEMTGSIPNQLYGLRNITSIRLYKSRFTGTISPEIASLQKLSWLWLHENHFSGTFPTQISELYKMESLTTYGTDIYDVESDDTCMNWNNNKRLEHLWVDCDDEGGCQCCTKCFQRNI